MRATIVSDTSCLILLEKIGELDLLQKLFGQVVITQIVAEEFGNFLPAWVRIKNSQNITTISVLETAIDRGEASAIALALEMKECLLILLSIQKITKNSFIFNPCFRTNFAN